MNTCGVCGCRTKEKYICISCQVFKNIDAEPERDRSDYESYDNFDR